jgi:hypothetical protein
LWAQIGTGCCTCSPHWIISVRHSLQHVFQWTHVLFLLYKFKFGLSVSIKFQQKFSYWLLNRYEISTFKCFYVVA